MQPKEEEAKKTPIKTNKNNLCIPKPSVSSQKTHSYKLIYDNRGASKARVWKRKKKRKINIIINFYFCLFILAKSLACSQMNKKKPMLNKRIKKNHEMAFSFFHLFILHNDHFIHADCLCLRQSRWSFSFFDFQRKSVA